jgi:hypothetical protein
MANEKESESEILNISEDTAKKDENNNKYDSKYHILKFSIVNLIGFGIPLTECLKSNDKLRKFFNKIKIILIAYQVYCFLIIHLSLILNIHTIYKIVDNVLETKEFAQNKSTPFILSFMHILAVFAFDIMFHYRETNAEFIDEICGEEFFIDKSGIENNQYSGYRKVFSILQRLKWKALDTHSNYFWIILIITFILPILCHIFMIYMFYMLYHSIETSTDEVPEILRPAFKFNIIFFPFSTIIITFTIIQYILSCLLMILKFDGLNKFIQALIDNKKSKIENKTTEIEDKTTEIEEKTTEIEDKTTGIEDKTTEIEGKINEIKDEKTKIENLERIINW